MNQFADEYRAEKAVERRERQRLAWLGFYNTATIVEALTAANDYRPIDEVVEAMMKEYNERWENDD